ncbi:MAG: sulfurtransferase complex subunit TusB [Gammaproteobacteria bacterium]|nr:sulfurtransferase complex subunit TusB [Gammaproteobacteria bacterium]
MTMLHTVNKSPFERNTLTSCISMAQSGSAVLLIEDGIFASLKGTSVSDKVSKAMGSISFYVLGPDLNARGMTEDQLIDGIKVVDYEGFVDLTAEHDNVQAWL